MKLKSKLIATIVSMCAAIAVMGVGVWASTANMFTVVVNNDVDVKILNVNADVYGEFAVYSQFSGSVADQDDATPTYAKRITANAASIGGEDAGTYKNRSDYDHGYLLYAIGIGGYNDGQTGAFKNQTNYKVNEDATWGYGKFINEAKNNVFLATKNGTLTNSNTTETTLSIRDEGAKPFNNSYNVDSTTHIAQVTYMYTINQWPGDGADNAIFGSVNAALSEKTISKIAGTNKAGYNSLIIPNLYVGKDVSGTTAWQALTLDAAGAAYFELPDTSKGSDVGGTYYVLLTFTFARNNANLDLQELQDALNHSLTLVTSDNKDSGKSYTKIDGSGAAKVYSANSGALSNDNKYTVTGEAYNPNTNAEVGGIGAQVTGAYNQERLKNVFALDSNVNTKSFLPADGFIYIAGDTGSDLGTGFEWVRELYQGSRSSQTPYGVSGTLLG